MICATDKTDIFEGTARVREVSCHHGDAGLIEEVSASQSPVILRGFVSDWPVVDAGKSSIGDLQAYLARFDNGAVVPVSAGPAELDGRLFYNDDFTGVNVDRGNAPFTLFLDRVFKHGPADPPPLIYLASTDVDAVLPGFRHENDVDFGSFAPLRSVWIGTRTRVAAHNDLPLNIACVAAGERRFTLFPPDQTPNLYVGPFELTPASRPISLVDFAAPDLEKYPRFEEAVRHAQIADLEPGDAIFIPSMWWHHVEATGPVNILVNYWWRTSPAHLGTPQDVLHHAMKTLRDLPPEEKAIWKHMFEHYVFDTDGSERDHIPENARGILDPITPESAARIRAFLRERLNR